MNQTVIKYDSYLGSILRPDNAAGCSGHSSREEVAGDSDKCGEPERWEEGWGLPLVVPRSGEQEREEGDPGLWTGQSKRHHGAGRVRTTLHNINKSTEEATTLTLSWHASDSFLKIAEQWPDGVLFWSDRKWNSFGFSRWQQTFKCVRWTGTNYAGCWCNAFRYFTYSSNLLVAHRISIFFIFSQNFPFPIWKVILGVHMCILYTAQINMWIQKSRIFKGTNSTNWSFRP